MKRDYVWTQLIGRMCEAETEYQLILQTAQEAREKAEAARQAVIEQYGKQTEPQFIMWAGAYFVVFRDTDGEVLVKQTEVKS